MVRVCLRLSRFASHGYDESDSVVKLPGGMVVTHELMPGQPVPATNRLSRGKLSFQPPREFFRFCRFAFPDGDHAPAEFPQGGAVEEVAGDIALQFLFPPSMAGFRNTGIFANFVQVPQAAVDKDNRGMAGHDKVRLSREILPVKRKPEPYPVQNAPDHFLR